MKDEIIDNIKADLLYCYEDSYSTKEEYERELDYITNLQYKLSATETNEETFRLEMEEITKILGLSEDALFDEVKEKATNLQEEIERWAYQYQHDLTDKQWEIEDYKSRCEKLREYINTHQLFKYIYDEEEFFEIITDKEAKKDLLNILNGGDEE